MYTYGGTNNLDNSKMKTKYQVLHGNIDQTLVKSLHGLLNFEIGGLDCRVIATSHCSVHS